MSQTPSIPSSAAAPASASWPCVAADPYPWPFDADLRARLGPEVSARIDAILREIITLHADAEGDPLAPSPSWK